MKTKCKKLEIYKNIKIVFSTFGILFKIYVKTPMAKTDHKCRRRFRALTICIIQVVHLWQMFYNNRSKK